MREPTCLSWCSVRDNSPSMETNDNPWLESRLLRFEQWNHVVSCWWALEYASNSHCSWTPLGDQPTEYWLFWALYGVLRYIDGYCYIVVLYAQGTASWEVSVLCSILLLGMCPLVNMLKSLVQLSVILHMLLGVAPRSGLGPGLVYEAGNCP